jgi:transcription initiation factor TFIIF subunit beta
LKVKVNQPELYLKETLEIIAIMHNRGDFNGKWELKPEYREKNDEFVKVSGSAVAPKMEPEQGDASDVDMKLESGGGESDDEMFEDIQ